MRTFFVLTFALMSASISAEESRPRFDQALNAGMRPGALARLDDLLTQQVENEQISGFVALIARDGKVGYEQIQGFRDLKSQTPMTRDTIFAIASMTKPMVVITAMTLWEEGKFKLDDPISDVLPEWKDVNVQLRDDLVPADRAITPRMLMTHSAGMDNGQTSNWPAPPTNPYAMTSEEFSKTLAARPLLDQPGTKYRYGYSIGILGRYIEALEGKSLDVIMQERLLGPLKLKDTDFWLKNKNDLSRVATMYIKDQDGKLVRRQSFNADRRLKKPMRMEGSGALHSTVDDYYRFAQMLANKGELDGTRILKPETVDLICQVHLRRETGEPPFGLGGAVNESGHYGWSGGSGVTFWVNTSSKCCGVFMIQTYDDSVPSRTFLRLGQRATSTQ